MMVIGVAGCHDKDKATTPSQGISESRSKEKETRWFTDITDAAGLDFVHESGATGRYRFPEINGSGVALLDYDNDGDLDIYFANGAFDPKIKRPGNPPVNRLYRREADGRYTDVTGESGLGNSGYGSGAAVGDFDNDGDVDVYLTNFGPDRLLENRGNGSFEDVTRHAGIKVTGWSSSAAFFDYDRDGYLDLYVVRYLHYDPEVKCRDFSGRLGYCGPKAFPGIHDILLHNNGDGTFTDVTKEAGIAAVAAPGLGVVCEDFDGDGWVDVYVTNDGKANQLWINGKKGSFHDEAWTLGTATNMNGQAEAGMGVVASDFDNDGDPDLFMTHLRHESNTFYRNLGGGVGFEDRTASMGLGRSSLAFTGFGAAAFDVELDGDIDLFIVNGAVKRGKRFGNDAPAPWDVYAEPNLFYRNDGSGRFEWLQDLPGSLCRRVGVSRGLAIGDIDDDGDIDLVLTNIQGRARLYRNDVPRKGAWLIVRAMDPQCHRNAIGAVVTVVMGKRRLVRTVRRAFSYLSSSDPRAHFGLGGVSSVDRIVVRWPDGTKEVFPSSDVNRIITLRRGTGAPQP